MHGYQAWLVPAGEGGACALRSVQICHAANRERPTLHGSLHSLLVRSAYSCTLPRQQHSTLGSWHSAWRCSMDASWQLGVRGGVRVEGWEWCVTSVGGRSWWGKGWHATSYTTKVVMMRQRKANKISSSYSCFDLASTRAPPLVAI